MKIRAIILVLFAVGSVCAWGAEREYNEWDMSLKTGGVLGTVTPPSGAETTDPYPYGGIPFVLSINKDIVNSLTIAFELGFVADFGNVQVTRTGFDFSFAYHLVGGARRIVNEYGNIIAVSRNPSNLSLVFNVGFSRYDAVSKNVQLAGSIFEGNFGLQYRMDTSDESALVFQLTKGLLSLSAGREQIASSLMEFDIGWRFFL